MPHTIPPYLNASDPLTRLELLCVGLNVSPDELANIRQQITEAREEREMWRNAYMEDAIRINELEKEVAVLHQQNMVPLYGPPLHPIEDFLIETDKRDFVREKLRQFAKRNSPSEKGFYKKLAAIITTWKQLGWLRAENYYGSEDHFVRMLQGYLDNQSPLKCDSFKKALRRQEEIRNIEQSDLKRLMLDEYSTFQKAV